MKKILIIKCKEYCCRKVPLCKCMYILHSGKVYIRKISTSCCNTKILFDFLTKHKKTPTPYKVLGFFYVNIH